MRFQPPLVVSHRGKDYAESAFSLSARFIGPASRAQAAFACLRNFLIYAQSVVAAATVGYMAKDDLVGG
jgi:hypothetical protein